MFGKSESTIRAISRELRRNRSKQIKLSTNENGREIILLNKAYLDGVFVKSIKHGKTDSGSGEGGADIVAFLQDQILKKDEQISQLGFLLAQAQDEKKQILLINEKPKKRWSLFRRK
jgi:hypothetical protein